MKSRADFEKIPDEGIIGTHDVLFIPLGKSLSRVFNVVWNWVFKGFIGGYNCLFTWAYSQLSSAHFSANIYDIEYHYLYFLGTDFCCLDTNYNHIILIV